MMMKFKMAILQLKSDEMTKDNDLTTEKRNPQKIDILLTFIDIYLCQFTYLISP